MNVVIACGGTGGHLFPGLAVAEVLRQRNHNVLIFISEKEIDALAVRDHVGMFRFEKLPSVGLPRLVSPAMLGFARGFAVSVSRCRAYYRDFRPDAVLGMGGFTSTAPMLAGRLMKVPTFIHESNAIPGKANRINARLAKVVLLGFAECAKFFPKARIEVTGTPIRAGLREHLDQRTAQALFQLHEGAQKKNAPRHGREPGRAWDQRSSHPRFARVEYDAANHSLYRTRRRGGHACRLRVGWCQRLCRGFSPSDAGQRIRRRTLRSRVRAQPA